MEDPKRRVLTRSEAWMEYSPVSWALVIGNQVVASCCVLSTTMWRRTAGVNDFFPEELWDTLAAHQGPTVLFTLVCGYLFTKRAGLRSAGDLLREWKVKNE